MMGWTDNGGTWAPGDDDAWKHPGESDVDAGGKPSKGTSKDKRLKENK